MPSRSLSDAKIRSLRPRDRPYKVSDRDGLYVWVSVTGTRSFRYNYPFLGKQKTLTYGQYPQVTLDQARKDHLAARIALHSGQDPVRLKKQSKAQSAATTENTFSEVAHRWYEQRRVPKKAKPTLVKDRYFLKEVEAAFGSVPIKDVSIDMVLGLLRSKLRKGQRNWPGRL
jgi:hypothetical protein